MSVNDPQCNQAVTIAHVGACPRGSREILRFAAATILIGALAMSAQLHAATITVTGTADIIAVDGAVTLREAIASINNAANTNADVVAVGAYGSNDTILFNIPGAGVRSIALTAALIVTVPVLINGYSQPLASANTNGPTQGSNAVLLIELNASFGTLLSIAGGNSTIQGLAINGAGGTISLTLNGGNTIAGNFMGTNPAGTALSPNGGVINGPAILIGSSSSGNLIGGTTPSARNVISGTSTGVTFNSGILITSTGNQVLGNLIGTNAAGTAAIPNDFGINMNFGGASNVIGGVTAAERNVVSGNRLDGVDMAPSGGVLQGNFIGTDVTGSTALGNGNFGVVVVGSNTLVGGLAAGAGNLVSGNTSIGIGIAVGATGNTIQGNRVGTDATGTVAVGGHSAAGIEVDASNNLIGGTAAGAGNTVAFNLGHGVRVGNGTGSAIEGNSIFANGGLGIKLDGGLGPIINDPGDADTGANNFQNYPVLTAASVNAGSATISGTLNSAAGTNFRVEFFASAVCEPFNLSHGEGQSFIGFANVATDAGGNASFGPVLFAAPAGQAVITATATDPLNNTSEFSVCVAATAPPLPSLSINNVSANEGDSGTTPFAFTVTLSAASASTVTVNYATANVTATAGTDYVAASGMLSFAPGVTTQPVTVLVNGDTQVEPDETFAVNLTAPVNATLATAQGTGTIVNDDIAAPPGTLQFSASAYSAGEADGSAVITVTRTGGSGGAVSVTAATVAGGTASAGTDYQVTTVVLNWLDGDTSDQTFSIPIFNDILAEQVETVNLALSAPSGGAALGAQSIAVLSIIDDDVVVRRAAPLPIPTLARWSLLLLAALLGLSAVWAMQYRNRRGAPKS
jgi:Calx-beta domain/IPTL-CTERM motif